MTHLVRIETRADKKRFIEYPYEKYAGDPIWVPPLLIGEWERLDPKRNPFFEHARATLYLAERDGRVVGRVAAIDNDRHNETHGDNLLFFGFFEAQDEEAALTLLAGVEREARELGRDHVRGPVDLTMDDGAGFQLDAYDTIPYVMMPQNPPTYPAFAEAAGFGKAKDLYAWHFDAQIGVSERIARLADRVRKRHDFVVREADMSRFDEEVDTLKQIYNEAWEKNWGFVKVTDAEFDHLAKDLKMILDPRIALFLEMDGKVVGTAVAIPNIHQVLRKFNGRLLPFGIFYLLLRKRWIDQARLGILGVLPEYRNRGLELVLIHEIAVRGRDAGYYEGELSWILEDNDGINKPIAAIGAKLYKTYRVYDKPLPE